MKPTDQTGAIIFKNRSDSAQIRTDSAQIRTDSAQNCTDSIICFPADKRVKKNKCLMNHQTPKIWFTNPSLLNPTNEILHHFLKNIKKGGKM